MLLAPRARDATVDLVGADTEALIKEARRRRRRRWARRLLLSVVAIGVAAGVVVLATAGDPSPSRSAAATGEVLPSGPSAGLHLAGSLAVAPDGALYVADDPTGAIRWGTGAADDRVLVRWADGRFRVVAGDGTAGFSGDGGAAVRAELSAVSDLVFSPDGALYIADAGRVRVVGRNGVIRTIAGSGRARTPEQSIANGTPALSAALGSTQSIRADGDPLWIALSRSGQLYISTGRQILRLAAGKLYAVRAIVPSGIGKGELRGFGPIAIDAHGNIDVSCGPRGWPIWQVTPNSIAHYIGFARQSGGNCPVVEPGPGGAVYAGSGAGIARVGPTKLVSVFRFTEQLRGQYFNVTYFAFTPNGTLYADDIPGNLGFERHEQLVSVNNHHTSLLWQENNTTPK